MSRPRIHYTKTWLSISDQVAQLEIRGLQIPDRQSAEAFLGHINYYRFAGFCLAFQDAQRDFLDNTTFADIKFAHQFDTVLRDLFTEALELIEVDIRTLTAYTFGKLYGPFGHTKAANFHQRFDFRVAHSDWIQKLHDESKRSSELFVKHFRRKYSEFPDLPIWTATEVMSFGGLSRMIGGMKKGDRKRIANEYQLSPKVLSSVTHHLAYVRNLCAHHCRLWDRIWSIKPDLPDNANWRHPNAVANDRLFATLLLMKQMMSRSPAIEVEAAEWKRRVEDLFQAPPNVPDPVATMGLPVTWQTHPVWK